MKMLRAYILIKTKPGTSENVARDLRNIAEVKQADPVYGRFDVIAVVEVRDLDALAELVYKAIEGHPNIVHTETSIVL